MVGMYVNVKVCVYVNMSSHQENTIAEENDTILFQDNADYSFC